MSRCIGSNEENAAIAAFFLLGQTKKEIMMQQSP